MSGGTALSARDLHVGYGREDVLHGVDLDVLPGELTVIIGPNGSGKSTLLLALARILRARAGAVLLDDRPIGDVAPKEVARRLGFLPQSPLGPDGITVRELVARGRHPHQGLLRPLGAADHAVVDRALDATGTRDLADRRVSELSGGQRQRAWIAMVLAQETGLLLLDEPTTFLDVAHQVEVLDTCARLHADGRTVVAVLHDLSLAVRYATWLVLMKDGDVVAQGRPADVLDPVLVEHVFGVRARVLPDPDGGLLVVPVRSDVLLARDARTAPVPVPAGTPTTSGAA